MSSNKGQECYFNTMSILKYQVMSMYMYIYIYKIFLLLFINSRGIPTLLLNFVLIFFLPFILKMYLEINGPWTQAE